VVQLLVQFRVGPRGFAVLGSLYTVVRRQNRAINGCLRFGRHEYEMDGVTHRLCRVHHPAIDQHHRMTSDEVATHDAARK
jgi:hypothetical protein